MRTDIQSEPDKELIETIFEQDSEVDTSDWRDKSSEEQSFDELIEISESGALVLEESNQAQVDPLVVFAKELADASKKAGRTRPRDA
jgi:alpha-amylase/alpha-mannosidase (GH57 family)